MADNIPGITVAVLVYPIPHPRHGSTGVVFGFLSVSGFGKVSLSFLVQELRLTVVCRDTPTIIAPNKAFDNFIYCFF
jgi:hypothetical protein